MIMEIFRYTYGNSSSNNDHNGGRSSSRNNDKNSNNRNTDNNRDDFMSDNDDNNDDNDDNSKNGNVISESNDDHGNNDDNDSAFSNSRNSSIGPIINNDRRSNRNSDINNITSDGNKNNNDNHCINQNHNKSSNSNNNSFHSRSSDSSRSSSSRNYNETSNHDRIKQLYIDYMDGISLLQCIDINSIINITEFEKLCLFLNLYHCLLLHSYIIFNYPMTILKFVSFNCHCSYEIFGDVLSLAELEHNIIKYSMPKPDVNFIAQFYIPKSKYNFHVNIVDYRILWSIYCYAITNIHEILIYTKDKLNTQLNYIIEKSLMSSIIIKKHKSSSSCVIYLPIICQWYAKVIISSLTEIMKINFYEYYCNQFINNINNNDSNIDMKTINSSRSGNTDRVRNSVVKYYDAPSFMALMNSLSKHKQMLLVLWQHLR